MPGVKGKISRPQAKCFAVVTTADGERIDLGQVSGRGISRKDKVKGRAGRKKLNAREAKRIKEARDGS